MPSRLKYKYNDEKRLLLLKDGSNQHSILYDEVFTFISSINMIIPHELAPEYLPIPSNDFKNLDLFKALKDGKILALLINTIEPNTIDMRVIDNSKYTGVKKNAFIRDNLNLILKSIIHIIYLVISRFSLISITALWLYRM